MSFPVEPNLDRPARDPATAAVLRRTRRAVGRLLALAAGLVLAGSLVPNHWPRANLLRWGMDPDRLMGLSRSVVLGLAVMSVVARRALGNRAALRDPQTRASQFQHAHQTAAVIGALAAVLGLTVAVLVRPEPRELAPFWVAALGTILLAFPRGYELDDFDEPLPGSGEK